MTTAAPRLLASLTLLVGVAAAAFGVDPGQLAAARALFEQRKLAEAQAAFEQLAATDPKHAEINYHLGELALRRDALEPAVRYLEQAVATAPEVARYHRRLGDAYGTQAERASVFSQLGLAKKCLAAYQRAVRLDPNDVDAHAALFEYYRQAPGFVGGGMDKARAEAAEIKRLDAARGRQAFATLFVSEKKYAEAFAEYDAVLQTAPDDYAALFQVGRLAAMTGQQLERGLAALRRCLAQTPPDRQPGHAAAHWRIGNILEHEKDRAGARAAYEAALKADPNFSPAADALKKVQR